MFPDNKPSTNWTTIVLTTPGLCTHLDIYMLMNKYSVSFKYLNLIIYLLICSDKIMLFLHMSCSCIHF